MTLARVEKSLHTFKKGNFKKLSNIIQTEICVFENGSTDTVKIAWSPCVVRMRYVFVYIY